MHVPLADLLTQVVEDGYEFFAKRQLVTLFSAPNYCGEFDNAGAMMSVDETLLCSFQVRYLALPYVYVIHTDLCVDFKASGEESKVPLRSDECRSTGNTAAQTKEEGWQDGLKSPSLGGQGRSAITMASGTLFTFSFASFVPPFSIPFLSIFLSLDV